MKKILYIIPFLLCFANLFAQNWAPVGATWYHYASIWGPNGGITYRKITVVKDTIIQGKNCSKIVGDFSCSTTSTPMLDNNAAYTYMSNDSVYFYDGGSQQFYLLIDYGAIAGDTWNVILHPNDTLLADTLELRVDSTGQVNIDGQILKTLYISQINMGPTTQYTYMGKFIERIGGIVSLFPVYNTCSLGDGYLHCYTDNLIAYHRVSGQAKEKIA